MGCLEFLKRLFRTSKPKETINTQSHINISNPIQIESSINIPNPIQVESPIEMVNRLPQVNESSINMINRLPQVNESNIEIVNDLPQIKIPNLPIKINQLMDYLSIIPSQNISYMSRRLIFDWYVVNSDYTQGYYCQKIIRDLDNTSIENIEDIKKTCRYNGNNQCTAMGQMSISYINQVKLKYHINILM